FAGRKRDGRAVNELETQQEVPDLQGVLHRGRGYLEGLDDELDDHERQDNGYEDFPGERSSRAPQVSGYLRFLLAHFPLSYAPDRSQNPEKVQPDAQVPPGAIPACVQRE